MSGFSDFMQNGGGALAGGLLGMVGANQQMRNTKNLMGLQMQNQMALNKQMQQIQQENWENTGAEAQRKQLEKAGLSVGLMYGKGGAGGQTMGGGSGGSASMGDTPQNIMGMVLQGQMQQSQIELNKALAEKAKAEAVKTGGADTNLSILQQGALEIQNKLNNLTLDDVVEKTHQDMRKAIADADIQANNATISNSTRNEQIERIKNEAIESSLKLGLIKSNIQLNDQQIEKLKSDIMTNQFNVETQRNYPSMDKVQGKLLEELVNKVKTTFGLSNEVQQKVKK